MSEKKVHELELTVKAWRDLACELAGIQQSNKYLTIPAVKAFAQVTRAETLGLLRELHDACSLDRKTGIYTKNGPYHAPYESIIIEIRKYFNYELYYGEDVT